VDNEIKRAVISVTGQEEYDQGAKRLLGQKIILAHILVHAVDEFKGMEPKDVVQYIEGEPMIGAVPIDPGLTNRVVGFNSENAEINEGMVRFDIVFYVRMKNGLTQIIVNVEAQKNEPTEYHILNRAIFYVCRLVSSQKERDFVSTNYDDIKCIYSIWICMNMPENSMEHIHLARDILLGTHEWSGKTDMLNIVMIGLSKTLPAKDEKYELHRLLSSLLSMKLKSDEKLAIMREEYDIPSEDTIGKEIAEMCNLSEGIVEETTAEVTAKVTAEVTKEIILNMHKRGCNLQLIADVTHKSTAEVEEIIQKAGVAMV